MRFGTIFLWRKQSKIRLNFYLNLTLLSNLNLNHREIWSSDWRIFSRIGDRISRNFEPWSSDSQRVFHVSFHDLLSKVFMLSTEWTASSLFFFRFSQGNERNTRRGKRGRQHLLRSPFVTRVVVFLSRTTEEEKRGCSQSINWVHKVDWPWKGDTQAEVSCANPSSERLRIFFFFFFLADFSNLDSSVLVVCPRRSDSRAREKNSRRKNKFSPFSRRTI